jgi:hypothetical protein
VPKRTPPDRQMVVARNEQRVRLPAVPTTNPIIAEQQFAEWAESEGWTVSKRGWPDFMCRRGEERMAVEVKAGKDGLRAEQIAAISDLLDAGMPTFMWTPEHGLTSPLSRPAAESVASLRAERAVLIRMLRDAYHTPREVRNARNRLARGKDTSWEMKGLLEVQAMCFARHAKHQLAVPDEGLNLCAWLVKSSKQLTVVQMAEIVGLEFDDVERNLAFAIKHRDRFVERIMAKAGHAA